MVDEDGRPVKTENTSIEFEIQGGVKLLGVDNGARDNYQDFQSSTIETAKGRCLVIIQSTKNNEVVKIIAKSETFGNQEASLNIE